jgi:transposase
VPLLVEPRKVIAEFHAMIRSTSQVDLEAWLERARATLVEALATGSRTTELLSALQSLWSNGQTEGQITKLKLVKRQMYGRGKLDLLQGRLVGAN